MLRRFTAALLALALLAAPPAQASQATLVTPSAPLPMTSLASFLNAAMLSLGSCNSGTTAPANGTGAAAFAGECWINTTGNPWIFQYTVDGTHWTPFLYVNSSTFSQSYPGTSTNDAAPAGAIGELVLCKDDLQTSTVTITNASPGVISWSAHGLTVGAAVHFTTTGGLPTGLTVGVNYYVSSQGFGANSFSVSTSVDNALAGTSVNTSSAGSGTQTAVGEAVLANNTGLNVCGISLTAGDWDVEMRGAFVPAATTVLSHPTYASLTTISGTPNGGVPLDHATSVPLPQAGSTGGGGYNAIIQPVRYSLSGTTTIYGVLIAPFTTSTMTAAGYVRARRVR